MNTQSGQTFKEFMSKGFALGVTAGLLVTLFDGIVMLIPNTYVAYSYPILLITFNVFFWMTVGGLSGFLLRAFARNRKDIQEKESFYWALFFLLPFVLIYGFLGRLYISGSQNTVTVNHGFDYSLSFAWVLLILVFLIFYFRKMENKKEFSSIFFAFEITTFILLFQFCSNLSYIKKIPGFYFKYQNFFQNIIKLERVQFLLLVYLVGVLSIVGFYFITRFKIRPFFKEKFLRSNYCTIALLFFIVAGCLTGFFRWNHKGHIKEDSPLIAASKNKVTGKVSYVILIILDVVRADRLSIYGNTGATKNLENFSRHALVFENCVAPSSWTLPSHASLFTGLYPTEHGSHGNLDTKNKRNFSSPPPLPLSEEFVTLAEIFRDNGYKTCAIVSNYSLHSRLKIDQGFQYYHSRRDIGMVYGYYPFRPIIHLFCDLTNICPKYIQSYMTADDINKEAFGLLNKLVPSPFFLFINYLDAHTLYRPPRPFNGYFLDTAFPQLYRLKKQYLFHFIKNGNKEFWDAYQRTQYDGEIAFLDDQLGKFFSRLKQMGIYHSSLIIITSDHGELLGEHGLYRHRSPLYEGVTKVPLIIKFPFSRRVGREKKMISLVDLFPTILSICGIPTPDGISGKAFGNASSPVVSELYDYEIGEHRTLYDGRYKYMRYEHKKGPELYDLDKDPLEKENLAEKLPEVILAMEEKLQDWEKVHKPKYTSSDKEETISQEVLEGLKALGYIQ